MKRIIKQGYQALPLKKELFSLFKQVYVPSHSIYQHLYFKGVFTVKIDKDHRFRIKHHGYEVENELFWKGFGKSWEKESLNIWVKLCRKANCILDIGANTGVYALTAKAINPQARIYAFEPVKRVFDKLTENVQLNQFDIECHQVAVSNTDGKAIIYDKPTDHIYSVTVNKNLNAPGDPVIETEVEVITLSEFIRTKALEKVDLVKLDVETHEVEVLQGLGSYLTEFKPTLLIEILTNEVASGVEELTKPLGYLYFDIDECSQPKLVTGLSRSSYHNYLICQESVARQLQLV